MAVNKVVYNTENGPETLIDLTNDTVTPETLAEGVSAHDASGQIIVGTATPVETVPDYVKTEAEAVADKVVSIRDAYSFVFGGVSDSHTTGNDTSADGILHAGMGMNEINKRTQLDLVLNFGDIMNADLTTGYVEGFPYVKSCFDDVTKGVPFIQMQGNHDEYDTAYTEDEEKQKYFAYIGANNIGTVTDWGNRFRNYGYKDFADQKMRVIYLNSADMTTIEKSDLLDGIDSHISGEQFKWFIEKALDFSSKTDPENWAFIVCSHHPLNWYAWNAESRMTMLLNVLDAYKGKSSGSVTSDGITTEYNFAEVKAEFISHFHGHLHNFRAEKLGANGVLTITIPNACFDRNNDYGTSSSYGETLRELCGDVDENGNQRQFNKTVNTAEDTSFDVVVVDRTNKTIHCYNYGAGIDRVISYEKSEIINIIDTVGYTDNTRLSTSSGSTKTETGYVTTGLIDLTSYSRPCVIRTKGVDFSQSYSAVCGYTADGTSDGYKNLVSTLVTDGQIVLDSSGNMTLTPTFASNYIKICGYGSGENLIITINQEIE